jgi:acyl-CoA synthetase (AMP-forming)/AMP-acid ligase II
MLGYWQNEAATAEVRRGDWLRTGDLGRMDSAGYLYLAGRRSDMIKTGAHRVNPLDVEEVIAEMPGVAEVAVVPAPDELLGQTIRAVVVLQPGAPQDEMHVKAWCRERLAAYKVPKFVEFSAGLPRTVSGKIRRQELVSGSKT